MGFGSNFNGQCNRSEGGQIVHLCVLAHHETRKDLTLWQIYSVLQALNLASPAH